MKNKLKIYQIILILAFVISSIYFSAQKSLWRDEAFSILLSRQTFTQVISSTSQDFNPPVFYLLLHLWQAILGQNEIIMRLLPLTFSVLTIILVIKSKKIIFNNHQKDKILDYLLSFFIVSNAAVSYFSFELRNYSMLMFLVFLSLVLGIKAKQTNKIKDLILLFLVNTLILYTHNLGIFWIGAQFLSLLTLLVFEKKYKKAGQITILFISLAVVYLPWLKVLLKQTSQLRETFWLNFNPQEYKKELAGLFYINEGQKHFLIEEIKIFRQLRPFLILGMIISFFKYKNSRLVLLAFITAILGLYVFSLKFSPVFYTRYLSFLVPLMSIFLTSFFMFVKNISKPIFLILLGFYLYISSFFFREYGMGISKVDYKKIATLKLDKIYTAEDLDIMPCIFYQKSCYFVGTQKDVKYYVGFLQLAQQPMIESWSKIDGNKIGIMYRNQLDPKTLEFLSNKNYRFLQKNNLGDEVYLETYKI
jgi:4-amino-4-deoxy-L-arabinose transferase-like glycosyltransferase